MHYKPRSKPPKVTTEKWEIDIRLLDLLNIESKRLNVSRSRVFERALLTLLESPNLPLKFKTRARKKFLVNETTLELLENISWHTGIPKNALVNKALAEFLTCKTSKKGCFQAKYK